METDHSRPQSSPAGSAGNRVGVPGTAAGKDAPGQRTAKEIQRWFVDYLARLQNTDPEKIDVTVPFENFALDSVAAVGMTGDLEEWLGHSVDPTMVFDYPTIEAFSRYLAGELGG